MSESMTTKRVFLKPAPLEIDGQAIARKVRKPAGGQLAAEGEEVNHDTYWQRRINDGEVEIVSQRAPARSSSSSSSSSSAAK